MELNPQEIMDRIQELFKNLEQSNKHYGLVYLLGNEKKKKYQMELRAEIDSLREQGYLTGLIIDMAKGSDIVSSARKDYDDTLSTLSQISNAMLDIRAEIEAGRSLLTWSRMEYGSSTFS